MQRCKRSGPRYAHVAQLCVPPGWTYRLVTTLKRLAAIPSRVHCVNVIVPVPRLDARASAQRGARPQPPRAHPAGDASHQGAEAGDVAGVGGVPRLRQGPLPRRVQLRAALPTGAHGRGRGDGMVRALRNAQICSCPCLGPCLCCPCATRTLHAHRPCTIRPPSPRSPLFPPAWPLSAGRCRHITSSSTTRL